MKKYTTKKLKSQDVKKLISKHVTPSVEKKIGDCGDFLMFTADEDKENIKLYKGQFCGNRFCPICCYTRSKKEALMISILLKYLQDEFRYRFIFLTLTAPNVEGDKLDDEITRFNKNFKKMFERKKIRAVNKGYIRKMETTYNKEPIITCEMWYGTGKKKPMADYFERRGLKIGDPNPNYDTYHVHFHLVIAVNNSYFTDKTYIRQSEWLNIWRDVMGDQTITQVDVRPFKHEFSDVQEIAKYFAKSSDMLASQKVFDVFYTALKGRQILTYNGAFKEAVKLFKKGELDKYKDVDTTEYVYMLLYQWGWRKYVERELRKLTEDERERVNRHLIDEVDLE